MGWKSQDQSINLVLTDQNMPRMDGLTLIKNLRGMPQYAKTPILMLTTESSDAMKAQGVLPVRRAGWSSRSIRRN
jgi:two-component system chemotaxis response regulator CheY